MSNMSYCRFQNTSSDFDDCHNAMEEIISGDGARLSREELIAAKKLANRALDFLHMLAEATGTDWDEVDEHCLERSIDWLNNRAREGR